MSETVRQPVPVDVPAIVDRDPFHELMPPVRQTIGGPLVPRGALPHGAEPYRTIGPFDAASLPQGLRSEHRLKEGTWAVLNLSRGTIGFAWDDPAGGREDLVSPAMLVVPPQVLHHVEGEGPFELTITFHRA